jgi:hypothetical protein
VPSSQLAPKKLFALELRESFDTRRLPLQQFALLPDALDLAALHTPGIRVDLFEPVAFTLVLMATKTQWA